MILRGRLLPCNSNGFVEREGRVSSLELWQESRATNLANSSSTRFFISTFRLMLIDVATLVTAACIENQIPPMAWPRPTAKLLRNQRWLGDAESAIK